MPAVVDGHGEERQTAAPPSSAARARRRASSWPGPATRHVAPGPRALRPRSTWTAKTSTAPSRTAQQRSASASGHGSLPCDRRRARRPASQRFVAEDRATPGRVRHTPPPGRSVRRASRARRPRRWSSTMISSQSRMVLSRWAMMRQVQPRRRSARSIRSSVTGSRALVASSRMTMRGFDGEGPGDLQPLALAAAEVGAALGDRTGEAVPAAREHVCARRRPPRRCRTRASGSGRVPHGQVVQPGALEEVDVLAHARDRAHHDVPGDLLAGLAVEQDLSLPRLVEAADQVGDGGLAAARAADQRDAPAGLHGRG